MGSIAWCLVTLGRPKIVERAALNVFQTELISELCWVDNGSTPEDYARLSDVLTSLAHEYSARLVRCRYEENRGTAFGHNRAYALSSSKRLFANAGDIEMPEGGLLDMTDVLSKDDHRVNVSLWCYSASSVPERFFGDEFVETLPSGRKVTLRPAMPMGPRLFRRSLLSIAGWIHEGFGLCEWDDVEWSSRVKERCLRYGLQSLAITSAVSNHIPNTVQEDLSYRKMKASEAEDPKKPELIERLAAAGFPSFDPWGPNEVS